MKIIIAGTSAQQEVWSVADAEEIVWVASSEQFNDQASADAYIDLLFDGSPDAIARLEKLHPATIVVNSVIKTLNELNDAWIRINGWTTFLSAKKIEAAAQEKQQSTATLIFKKIGKAFQWTPDIQGFIAARVICMIINEAFFALEDEVSTRSEIDTAMKLGTAYPYGPFEWAEKIGVKNICELLAKLEKENKRYAPAPLLIAECQQS